MCVLTKDVTVSEVRQMAYELMNTTFIVHGKEYNMNKMGWSFQFNNRKTSLGLCSSRRRTVYISKWLVSNSTNLMATWRNTMLHEIAHAIDFTIRGTSSHDYIWRNIALTIGCNGKRCGSVEKNDKVNSKYTIKCNNCGKETAGHKKSKLIAQGRCSCGICSGGSFNRNFLLTQIQNY